MSHEYIAGNIFGAKISLLEPVLAVLEAAGCRTQLPSGATILCFEATFYIVASISCNSANEDTFLNYETDVSIRIQDHLTKGQECVPLELMISQKRSRNC